MVKKHEKYIIGNIKTLNKFKVNGLGKKSYSKSYYIDHFYTGKCDKVSYGMEYGYKNNINKMRQYKSKAYAEKLARKINYDCELGDTGNWLDVIPVSDIGKKIKYKE